MQIPAFLYGEYRQVKPACSKRVTALKRGASLNEIEGDGLDPAITPGIIAVEGPSPDLRGPNFHCFAFARVVSTACLEGRLPRNIWDSILEWAFREPGLLLGILGQDSMAEVAERRAQWPGFLRAATTFWSELDGLGERYTSGLTTPSALWDNAHTLHIVLARMGVPRASLQAPLPPGGLATLTRPLLLEAIDGGRA